MVFILLGLTGVLPLMISIKQSGFYLIPAFPFFAIGACILMYPFYFGRFKNISLDPDLKTKRDYLLIKNKNEKNEKYFI